jgi:FAD/FMN-containing dehydrogenase
MVMTSPRLIAPYASDYRPALQRAIWNKRLDDARFPEAIAVCQSVEDVAGAVRYAGSHGLRISPRGSGHHYEAAALRDGGLLLDLGDLNFIEVDTQSRTARVGAGVRGGDLSACLARHGLAFPVGHCADVGLSGYLLAGGFGWNAGEWGAACANVVAIEAVTASGAVIRADARENAELFWAARGGGPGFFAAIVAYHLRLHPLPAAFAWRATFAARSAPALAKWLTEATDAAHPSVEIGCFLLAHPRSGAPAIILRASACASGEAEAEARLARLTTPPKDAELLDEPAGELVPFPELAKLSPMPSGKRVAADHLWSNADVGDLLMAVYDMPAPGPHSTIDIVALGGHSCPILPANAALSMAGRAGVGIYALWDDAADDARHRAWVRGVDAALAPYRTGRYVGEADLTRGPGRLGECYHPEALARLQAVREREDPGSVFFRYPESPG